MNFYRAPAVMLINYSTNNTICDVELRTRSAT